MKKTLDLTKNQPNSDKEEIIEENRSLKKKNNSKSIPKSDKDSGGKKKRIFLTIILVLFFILLSSGAAALYFVIIPAQHVTTSVNTIQDNVLNLAKDLEAKDISKLKNYVSNIQTEINKIDQEIDKYDVLATLDATKGYYNNFKVGKKILRKSSDLLNKTLPELTDLLELSGFTANSSVIIEATTEEEKGALNLILEKLPDYLALYENIEPEILDILNDFKEVNTSYVPNVGGYDLKTNLAQLNSSAEEFPAISKKVQDFLNQLPKLVGSDDSADYLLILQNETEMRSSGGLLTAFGHMNFKKGEIGEDIFLADMWDLENYLLYTLGIDSTRYGYNNIYGQLVLMNANCGAYHLRAQDSGIYPDLTLTMKMLSDYYDTARKNDPKTFPDYDYILTLNNNFATNLISLIEPLEVEGFGTVTADELYDFIKGESDRENAGSERKDIIKDIANAAKIKFLELPLEKLPQALNILINGFQAKDIALSAPNDTELQAYFDSYGMSGRIANDFKGDYFHFNEAQNCSLKLNKFIRDSIDQNVFINSNGTINREVKVTWIQPKVFEPGLEKQYSPYYNFSYRAWVRVFAPEGSTAFVSDGFKQSGYLGYTPVTYFDTKVDKQINDNIVQFDHRRFKEEDPVFRKEMNISYKLPLSINYQTDGEYKLLIQKHPGKSWGEQYKFNIHEGDNKYSIEFTLDRDKVLTYKDGIVSVNNYDTSLDWISDLVAKIPLDKLAE